MKIKYGEGRFSVALSDKASLGSAGKILGAFTQLPCQIKLPLEVLAKYWGRLAQLVERFPYKEDVGSSSLSTPTI